MGRKSRGMWKEVRWSGHAQLDFKRENVGQNGEYRELKEMQKKKEMWNETKAKQQSLAGK